MRLDMRRFIVAFAGVVALAICSVPVQAATVLFNNLSAPSYQGSIVNAPYGPLADSFSTGSTPITLTDVKVDLSTELSDPPATLSLMGDNNTSPGSLIFSLGSVNASGGATVYDVPGLSVSLAANTRYWIQVGTSSSTYVTWMQANNDSGTGVSSEYSYSGGQVYANSDGGSFSPYPYLMEVSGVATAVPEPPVLPLFALGFLTMVFLARRRFAR